MAKYSPKAGEKVEKVMHELKEGTLKTGSGKKVTNKKQAIAIGLSEAKEEGAKVPKKAASKKSTKKSTTKKTAAKKKTAPKKTAAKKAPTKKPAAKKTARKRSAD
jgi:hypothetical protein